MKTCELTLPYPPNVNHYKKVGRIMRTKTGKLYQARTNTDETKIFYWQVVMLIRSLKRNEGLESFGSATISVEIDVYPPDKRKRDLDGILKTCLDSMQRGGLYDDDYQIARLLVKRCDITSNGMVVVRVSELE